MSGAVGPIVVGVDGTYTAIRAARWAAFIAEKFAAPLHIVNTKPYIGLNLSDSVANLRASEMAAQNDSAQSILQAAEHAVRADYPDLEVTTTRACSPADEALTELSRQARLIVLGSEEMSLGTAILVGSTTVAVAAHSRCPVVAWRGALVAPTEEPIVLGVDGVHNSGAAIASAFEFADRLGVGIVAVHAWSTRRSPGDVTLPFMIDWDEIESDERQLLADAIAPWIKLHPDVGVTCVVEPDRPSRALLSQLRNAQLVVVGSRGRGLLAGTVLGSTGLNLLHHSPVPVMICRAAERDD